MNSHFKELLSLFNEEGVEFLVVGAHAIIHYTEPRYTKDIDVWVRPTSGNADRVHRALARFGAPLSGVRPEDFADPEVVYQMGVPPNRIDILMGVDGLDFDEVWPNRVALSYAGESFCIPSRPDLIRNKRASGRPQDLLDLRRLEEDAGNG